MSADSADSSQPSPTGELSSERDAYGALRLRDYRLFLIGHIVSVLGVQMQTVAVGWQLYEQTRSAWALGFVGLAQFTPMLCFALPAGQVADRYDRRKVLMGATLLAVVAAFGLALSAARGNVALIYACLFLSGTARAFQGPARSALVPQLVPRALFSNAVSWNVSAFELASLTGPALGGWLIALLHGAQWVYVLGGLGSVWYFSFLAAMTNKVYVATGTETNKASNNWQSLLAGFTYLWNTKALFAAISLDMFAVLLGGAVALLPVYAKDILHVGPTGLGWMQAMPSFGAISMALLTTHLPPLRKAGRTLLWAVAGFGLATIVFGLSRNYWLSLTMLFLMGALDNISVVVRHVLVQMLTPDEMRGRVSAVNGMFINASNELGRFESGALAALTTPVFSVVAGGIGTLLVVLSIAMLSPALRQYGALDSEHKSD
jgi:MFS family permease